MSFGEQQKNSLKFDTIIKFVKLNGNFFFAKHRSLAFLVGAQFW